MRYVYNSQKETGGPAFPINFHYVHTDGVECFQKWEGMSLWDKFFYSQAKAITSGYCDSKSIVFQRQGESRGEAIARMAADYADAMIAERKKRFG